MGKENSTSLAQIEANRKNALKSTGPKTLEGKRAVRFNALKHGLLSKAVVISDGDGKESQEEFDELLSQLRENLRPRGMLEEMLVERIAVCYWRLRRAVRAEVGLTRLELDHVRLKYDRELHLEANPDNLYNSSTLDKMLRCLEDARKDIEETGTIGESVLMRLERWMKGDGPFVEKCLLLTETLLSRRKKEVREAAQASLVELISQEKDKVTRIREYIIGVEKKEVNAMTASKALPPVEVTDKILRYETAIERQLYRTIHELERLQQQRIGEFSIWFCLPLLRGEMPTGETKPNHEDESA